MRRENNRKCLVCGKVYTYCPSCAEDAHKPTWLALYCSENCKKIFMTVTDLHGDDLTIEQAKTALDECDMTNKANFNANLLEDINKIYAEYKAGHGSDSVKKIYNTTKAEKKVETTESVNESEATK